ncbi:hypothetical protein D9619_001666 [Psilocybe cf. subviscida]|uniref:Alpha/beta hydrolase fold-3 domain-containing protein n=1 Tax=Psilocybe cf. subviscida TaxID=2480587 RepID=A0A8H5F2K3_9AGAR|nr:hypothetical protein D9619_001666 [Psilocybe cf. subviscida]
MNALTRDVGIKVGPVMLDVLVKHFFDRLKHDNASRPGGSMKQEDVLYHEAFTIVKSFLNAASSHTIEELQSFSNTRTPTPPWTHVFRVIVPLSCCEEAAIVLIKALGGEETARRLVGGVKWWQVRGINGVDGQWMTAKKDWQEEKKRHKSRQEREKNSMGSPPGSATGSQFKDEPVYDKDMDAMRCILYLHGGGYYFGSVDQERYSIQRFARKINGRVFAINYRLAPQYPFPCALQDAIAAYLFLIRPPPDSIHKAVNPGHIIISGDSAGGGLSLALLQVIRDAGLPTPAAGVLISPWCDLKHSFPSIHLNTDTDIIPECGLSFHKPSLLWPPPDEELSSRVHASLRFRIRQAFRQDEPRSSSPTSTIAHLQTPIPNTPVVTHEQSIADPEVIPMSVNGEIVEVREQLQFYTQNSLLCHPLVSPAMAYLGGLPPLMFIAGDKEVLRDEIIYTAHRAAYPEKYPPTDKARELYPALDGIDTRFGPTSVHLQVYDDAPHILPVLFSFTTPAKFCFRAIASFCKFVTDIQPPPTLDARRNSSASLALPARRPSFLTGFRSSYSAKATKEREPPLSPPPPMTLSPTHYDTMDSQAGSIARRTSSIKRRLSFIVRASPRKDSQPPIPVRLPPSDSILGEPIVTAPQVVEGAANDGQPHQATSIASSDVGGPRFQTSVPPTTEQAAPAVRKAGEISVYDGIKSKTAWECRMIRERVNISGDIRPLEPEAELDAFQVPAENIGRVSELTAARYIKDRTKSDHKFAGTLKSIEKVRRRNLERAKKDTIKRMSLYRRTLENNNNASPSDVVDGSNPQTKSPPKHGKHAAVLASPGWGWAWVLDESEDPPPSSIASRRDTQEAQKLAEVADQAILGPDHTFSGNHLWSVVMNFLTATPGKKAHTLHKRAPEPAGSAEGSADANINGHAADDGAGVLNGTGAAPAHVKIEPPPRGLTRMTSKLWGKKQSKEVDPNTSSA